MIHGSGSRSLASVTLWVSSPHWDSSGTCCSLYWILGHLFNNLEQLIWHYLLNDIMKCYMLTVCLLRLPTIFYLCGSTLGVTQCTSILFPVWVIFLHRVHLLYFIIPTSYLCTLNSSVILKGMKYHECLDSF